MKSRAVRRSAFDYPVAISRRGRYLLVSAPDLGLHAGTQCLLLDRLDPAQLGQAVLGIYERVRSELDRISLRGDRPPAPLELGRKETLSVAQAARALGVTPFILRKLTAGGEIPCTRTPGGHRRYKLEALSHYLAASEGARAA